LQAYVDELTDRNVISGIPRDEARRQALVAALSIVPLVCGA